MRPLPSALMLSLALSLTAPAAVIYSTFGPGEAYDDQASVLS